MHNLNSRSAISGPVSIVNLLDAIVRSESDLIVTTVDLHTDSVNNISMFQLANLSDAFEIVKAYVGSGSEHVVLVAGSEYVRGTTHDALIEFIDAVGGNLLDDVVVDWNNKTTYSAMCDNEADCCGPNNQISYVTKQEEDEKAESNDIDADLDAFLLSYLLK